MCDNCFSQDFEWVNVSGKGKLVTYTVIHVAPQQFQALTPYAVGIVELENGLKIPGMIQGTTQEHLKIGMDLMLDFGTCSSPSSGLSGQGTALNLDILAKILSIALKIKNGEFSRSTIGR